MTCRSKNEDFSCVSIRPSMCDGCGYGHDKIAGCVQKISACLRPSQMAMIIFYHEIYSVQLLILGPQRVARYEKYAIVGACQTLVMSKNTRSFGRTGPERDMIFHLHVTACRDKAATIMTID